MSRPVYFCACGDHAFSPLTKGFMAMVSPEDAYLLKQHWRVHLGSGTRGGYATILSPSGGQFVLSRVITNAPSHLKVDHANRDTMDNRRPNLRVCTHAENMRNSKHRRGGILPKGVRRYGKKYRAIIHVDGISHDLGTFSSVSEAAEAYRNAAPRYHGEFARVA